MTKAVEDELFHLACDEKVRKEVIMEPVILSLLSDDLIRIILNELNKKKKVKFKEIRNFLIHETDEQTSSREIQKRLDCLKDRKLVGVVKSDYKDFDSYYLTTDGLKTVRAFNNVFAMAK